MEPNNFRIISAGAGSGKTYRLTSEMVELLKKDVRASGIIATTFTKKAADELQERVRVRLLEDRMSEQADDLANALIGTVHSLGVRLLQRFAFEAGVSPEVSIIAEEDQQLLFNQALATVLTQERVEKIEALSDRLGFSKNDYADWRREVNNLSEVIRANGFSREAVEWSKKRSFETFLPFLGEPLEQDESIWYEQLAAAMEAALREVEAGEDTTKKTDTALAVIRDMQRQLKLRGNLFWHQWVKLSKLDVGAKSREAVAPLKELAASHDRHPGFHEDIRSFLYALFETAQAALDEYAGYKKSRGLIDYTDMEVLVNELLEQERVKKILAGEIDLLMVDEFQDTSPIQLEIFLKLSRLARYSVWVGDPKQSIYGFRGADPKLMQAIIEAKGGIRKEDIQTYSWRSREDIVYATNALFVKAFPNMPEERIKLKPKRKKKADEESLEKVDEPPEMDHALIHWHFQYDGEGKRLPGRPWMENCMATAIRQTLEEGKQVLPKGAESYRSIRPGDIAILCRSNKECQEMAGALHRAGLKASIARAGLLYTAEVRLVLACLKYVLNRSDSLSVAEILKLAAGWSVEKIIEHRLDFLEKIEKREEEDQWALSNLYIAQLNTLRERMVEFSSAEILHLLLEELDLRRVISSWGNALQRLANVEALSKLAVQYEDACNRMLSAASLGGFLLWLNHLEKESNDMQGASEDEGAVKVITYHRSKGLEYPLVICSSLENNLRGDVWGIKLISEQEAVDLDNVLGNRWLRYWINPYADQVRNTNLETRLQESEEQRESRQEALEEEARLLYVGITRARDFLVFPTRPRATKWLNRVWHLGQEDTPTLDADSELTPWTLNGDKILTKDTRLFAFPRDFPQREIPKEVIWALEAREGREVHRPYRYDLRQESLHEVYTLDLLPAQTCHPPLRLEAEADRYQVAKAVKAFLIADRSGLSPEKRSSMLEGMLQRFEVAEMVKDSEVLGTSKAFLELLQQECGSFQEEFRKYPVRTLYEQRLFETVADFVLVSEKEVVLVQNSGFAGEAKQLKRKARELGDWLFLCGKALEQVFSDRKVRYILHFVLFGQLQEVEFTPAVRQMELF